MTRRFIKWLHCNERLRTDLVYARRAARERKAVIDTVGRRVLPSYGWEESERLGWWRHVAEPQILYNTEHALMTTFTDSEVVATFEAVAA